MRFAPYVDLHEAMPETGVHPTCSTHVEIGVPRDEVYIIRREFMYLTQRNEASCQKFELESQTKAKLTIW